MEIRFPLLRRTHGIIMTVVCIFSLVRNMARQRLLMKRFWLTLVLPLAMPPIVGR